MSNEEQQQQQQGQCEQRKQLIVRNLQEVLGQDKLTKQLAAGKNVHIYWGTATTGRPHVGYLVPVQKIADFLRADVRVTILFADLHAFLDNMKSSMELLQNRLLYYECVVKALLGALNVPLEKLNFVRGRSYQLTETYTKDLLRLCNLISLRDAIRAGAEVVKQVENPPLSGILYPLLQALDEQHLKVDGQFGGVDQRKIFILAEEQLPKMKFGKRFHLMNPMVPGLSGSKMSSSEENTKIDLLDTPNIVNAKIDSALCPKTAEDNGVLAFLKHVIIPIEEKGRLVLGGRPFEDFETIQVAYERGEISEQDLKGTVKSFLNHILAKVHENCNALPGFVDIVARAYPTEQIGNDENGQNIDDCRQFADGLTLNESIFETPFGHEIEFIPSERLHSANLMFQNGCRPLHIVWRCSPKGRLTMGHLSALLQLKHLSTFGHRISVVISDLDAFFDHAKCPWAEMKKRTDQYATDLKSILRALNMVENCPILCSADYEFSEAFTMRMYQAASVMTLEETALPSDGPSSPPLGSHLCPIYFALDVLQAKADVVLLGPNQRRNAKLIIKISERLRLGDEQPAFTIHPELVGTDGQKRMSATRPEFHVDIMQDGVKKIRQKIGKSFCELGNPHGNVALELCRNFLFPFYQQKWKLSNEEAKEALLIERKPENGGNLAVSNYAEVENQFLAGRLHPADLKAFLCTQLHTIFDALRNGQLLLH